MNKASLLIPVVVWFFGVFEVHAHNEVVVIPLVIPSGEDSVEVMPKPFSPLTKITPLVDDYIVDSETAIDNVTGLEWQRGLSSVTSYQAAINYCNELSLGNKPYWRLPTVAELQTLVDYNGAPAINTDIFGFVEAGSNRFWSITSVVNNNALAWYVSFETGLVDSYSKTSPYYEVRCVR